MQGVLFLVPPRKMASHLASEMLTQRTSYCLAHHTISQMMQLILAKYDRDFGGLKPELIDKRLEAIRKE